MIKNFLPLSNSILFFAVGSILFFHPSLAVPQLPITPLTHRVLDAEYSKQLDRIVTIPATSSNQLHVVDPATGSGVAIDLPLPPACVSVGPDGLFAAVGHSYEFTNVTGHHTIAATFETTEDPELFWAATVGNYWVYDGSDGSGGKWTRRDEITSRDSTTIPGVTTYRTDVYRNGVFDASTWISISPTESKEWREMTWDDIGNGPEWITILFNNGLIEAKNPFIIGDHWITTTTGTMTGSTGWSIPFNISLEVTVQAEEFVNAPLGTDEAFRLQLILHLWNDQLGIDQVATQYAWFVPYVGLVKSQDSSGFTESLSALNNQRMPLAPTNVSASDGTYLDRVRVTWAASPGAKSYAVYRATSLTRWARKTVVAQTSETFFDDLTAVPRITYYYWVTAYKHALGWSDLSSYDAGYRSDGSPPAPTNVSASDGTYTDRVEVTWSASYGATSHTVYRATSLRRWWRRAVLVATTSDTFFNDTTATPGRIYYYWVRATNTYGMSNFSAYDVGHR